jgi:hypothetical protein
MEIQVIPFISCLFGKFRDSLNTRRFLSFDYQLNILMKKITLGEN